MPNRHFGVHLPRWHYRPGTGVPDRETLDAAKAHVPARYEAFVPADDMVVAYGRALNDAGFFWECHEVLEAVWKAAPQGGRDRILLRAFIQTANGNLKAAMEKPRAAARLFAEARTELDELSRRPATHTGLAETSPLSRLAENLREPKPPIPLG